MIPAGLKERLEAIAELGDRPADSDVVFARFALSAIDACTEDIDFAPSPEQLICIWCRDPDDPRTCLSAMAEDGDWREGEGPCAVGRLARELGVDDE